MSIAARSVPLFLTVALVVTSLLPAEAATVKRYQLDELRDGSESIFWGEVVGRSARWGDGAKMIWTDYEVAVAESFKGARDGRTTVSFAGGTVGSESISVPGVPELEVGGHYVFFLLPGSRRPSATIGWGQGLFRVTRVNLGDTAKDLLVSYDGEPLQMSPDGAIERGPLVEIENGAIWDAALRQDPSSGRMADPVVTSSTGAVIPQARHEVARPAPLAERQFATIDDLRNFVRGQIASSRGGER